jgi:hypothetical protein
VGIRTPRDRNGGFGPQLVRKGQRRFEGFDEKILALYLRGLSTRDIEAHLAELYDVQVGRDAWHGPRVVVPVAERRAECREPEPLELQADDGYPSASW